jgi:mannitol 2-dehydrogenase
LYVDLPSFSVPNVNAPELLRLRASTLGAIASRGVPVPTYDRSHLQPRIAHIGVGGFHRAHLALYTHELAEAGSDWGIVGVGLLAQDEEMARVLHAQDGLYTLSEKGNGEPTPQIIGSLLRFLHCTGSDVAFCDLIASATTSIISLTITEAGYTELTDEQRAAGQTTTLDRLAAALDERRARGGGPVTILSCDNLPGNGTVARHALLAAASRRNDDLAEWVTVNCTFPNSMVDRITPATSDADRAWLRDNRGIDDRWPVVAEPFRQWVIEDNFAAGRPKWEDVGALFTDRVHDWELYKLRMLNAGHSCIAYLSALAGITFVDEAMSNPAVHAFLVDLLYNESVPTLTEIPGHPREDYVASVLERFANTGVRDQISRLCENGSAKFPTFLLPTIMGNLERGGPIVRGTTALAGWAHYLGVVPPERQSFDASIETARQYAAKALTDPVSFLDYAEVFPTELRDSKRFRAAFAAAYQSIEQHGSLAAMAMPEH